MRGLLAAALLGCCFATTFAQADQAVDPRTVAPDAFVTVHKDATGADLVQVRMMKKGYPLDLLQRQCLAVGKETASDVRGLYVYAKWLGGPTDNTAASAQFGCNNLIGRDAGELNLDSIVKSFLGGPEVYKVSSFLIVFDSERPTNKTIRSVRRGNVRVEAEVMGGQPGIEYRVVSLTQNPEEVSIPRNMPRKEAEPSSTPPASKKLHPLVVPLLGLGVAGAGGLVYLGLRREKAARRS